MNLWIKKENCTGCAACINSCAESAIHFVTDKKNGFNYPEISFEKCTKCYKCKRSCPVYQWEHCSDLYDFVDRYCDDRKIYTAWSKDDELRYKSTSGGIFSEFAQAMISENGVVFGAAYDEKMRVYHVAISDCKEIYKLRRSKYVQSDIGHIYRRVKEELQKKQVLFVGTPCQVAGLYGYLQSDYSNLYTVEFVCLGVNSPLAYKKWKEEIEKTLKKNIKDIWFKYKKSGWRNSPMSTLIKFDDDTEIVLDKYSNYYMKGYLQGGLYVRESCSNCAFVGDNRYADIIFGDYWNIDKKIDDGKGSSFMIIKSKKGQELFDLIKDNIYYSSVQLGEIIDGNPRFLAPAPYNLRSEAFFEKLADLNFTDAVKVFIGENTQLPDILKKISSDE